YQPECPPTDFLKATCCSAGTDPPNVTWHSISKVTTGPDSPRAEPPASMRGERAWVSEGVRDAEEPPDRVPDRDVMGDRRGPSRIRHVQRQEDPVRVRLLGVRVVDVHDQVPRRVQLVAVREDLVVPAQIRGVRRSNGDDPERRGMAPVDVCLDG